MDGLNNFGDGSGVYMFTFMGMGGELLSLVLQNRFADIEPLSDLQNKALFEILNPEDVFAILPTSTGHGKSIIFQCLPDLCLELCLRRFPYPSNAIRLPVKFPS